MKVKNAKPAAKKAPGKRVAAKPVATTGAVFIDMIGATGKQTKKTGAKSGTMAKGKVLAAASKAMVRPRLLPIQPPTFEPTHRTAAQLRAAVAAVMVKA